MKRAVVTERYADRMHRYGNGLKQLSRRWSFDHAKYGRFNVTDDYSGCLLVERVGEQGHSISMMRYGPLRNRSLNMIRFLIGRYIVECVEDGGKTP